MLFCVLLVHEQHCQRDFTELLPRSAWIPKLPSCEQKWMLFVYGAATDQTDKCYFLSFSALPESTLALPLNTDCVLPGARALSET